MRVHSECHFPHFRERFWAPAVWAEVSEDGEPVLVPPGKDMEAAVTRQGLAGAGSFPHLASRPTSTTEPPSLFPPPTFFPQFRSICH